MIYARRYLLNLRLIVGRGPLRNRAAQWPRTFRLSKQSQSSVIFAARSENLSASRDGELRISFVGRTFEDAVCQMERIRVGRCRDIKYQYLQESESDFLYNTTKRQPLRAQYTELYIAHYKFSIPNIHLYKFAIVMIARKPHHARFDACLSFIV